MASEDVPLLRLLCETRDAYREEIGRALAAIGCDDLPRNALVVLTGLDYSANAASIPTTGAAWACG